MNLTNFLVVAVLGLAIGGYLAFGKASATDPAREARGWELIADGALMVDVRTPAEFSAGHLDGAINISHDQTLERLAEYGTDKSRSIVVYCRSGRRSGVAHSILVEQGFTNVHNGGGYEPMLAAKP